MKDCPMHRLFEASVGVFAIVLLTKACRAFSGSGGVSKSTNPQRIPAELKAESEEFLLKRLELATELALKAGTAIKAVIHSAEKKAVTHKGETDLVTETDQANEKMIFDAIRRCFPGDLLIGEESSASSGSIPDLTDAPTWIVDPVDGTTNFVHGFPMTTVSIGFGRGGKMEVGVVYDPCLDELYQAVRGGGAFVNGARASSSGRSRLGDSLVVRLEK